MSVIASQQPVVVVYVPALERIVRMYCLLVGLGGSLGPILNSCWLGTCSNSGSMVVHLVRRFSIIVFLKHFGSCWISNLSQSFIVWGRL